MVEPLDPPPRWGQDNLSAFIETARRNTFATFVQMHQVWDLLVQIDGAYRRAIEGMHPPTDGGLSDHCCWFLRLTPADRPDPL